MTDQPTLTAELGKLIGHNGGWICESGSVTEFLFRFVADGVLVKGNEEFVQSSDPAAPMTGQYPNDPAANVLPSTALIGRSVYVEVSGGTVSDMTFAGGGKVIEWGDPARSNTIVVGANSPTPPSTPEAVEYLEVALPELLASWAYKQTKLANPFKFSSTHIGKAEQAIRDALKVLKGTG